MRPDISLCEEAWRARDPAYDGVFFVCVRSTGIYCRCVCPVRPPLRRNVEFLPSAAAAEAAGYRPCLRCRPETAPFCPAWKGSLATVDRAARLIRDDGALDGSGATVDALAMRVGVGARHLARLFRKHLGANPSQVARTARVQRAKRLLTDTALPMAEVAAQAGFASLRRFNAVFREVYRRPPSALRRAAVHDVVTGAATGASACANGHAVAPVPPVRCRVTAPGPAPRLPGQAGRACA